MTNLRLRAVLLFAAGVFATAQSPETRRETVVVTGTYEPLPLEEADRAVRSLDASRLKLVSNTLADLLKLDSSVDLRQRAPNTLQGDITIRGGTFGQTLVLLDGLRLNDVQSGHHNLDVPVPLESLSSVEILKGSGSTLYGSDAVGGVVNFITRTPETPEMRLWLGAGNFGVNQERGTLSLVRNSFSEQLSFARDFSTGFIPNRDYRNLSMASSSRFSSRLGRTYILLAQRDSPFGAEQFYGKYNSWERTRTWWAAIRQTFGQNTEASFAFRRHTDLFVLYRDMPQVFTNRHATENFQTTFRRRETLARTASLFWGAEAFGDFIDSNNLGRHQRARGAGYAAFDVRALHRFSFNAGVRDEVWGSANHQVSPTISGAAWLTTSLKLRGSFSRAFRLPSYTDLYYQDPSNRGSADLRPERAQSYEGGLDWNSGGPVRASLTVFHRSEKDGIDYVRSSPTDIWRATNFQALNFTGVEADIRMRLRARQFMDVFWTNLHGAQEVLTNRQSKYVFNYPVNSAVLSWQGEAVPGLIMRTRVGVVQRFERDAYAVWDLYAAGARGRIHPFVQFTNLSGTRYEEIPGVAMPGRALLGGLEIVVFGSH